MSCRPSRPTSCRRCRADWCCGRSRRRRKAVASIFSVHATPSRSRPRQSRIHLPRGLRPREGRQRPGPHGGPRRRLPARATAARGAARHPRCPRGPPAGCRVGAREDRGIRPDHRARNHPPHHEAALREPHAPPARESTRRIKDSAKTLKPGEWITGGDWDHTLWPGQPLPQHEWIDSVTPSNPVFVNRLDGHEALANAAAMRAAAVTKATLTPSGGEILRDPRTGEPTGIFKDRALDLVGHAIPDPSPAQRDSALARALAYAASLGVAATAHVSASWADLASYRRLEQAGRLTMRVALYLPLDSWRAVAETVSRSGRGDDWVKIGGVKGYMDASAGSRTAYFFESYSDSAGYNGLLQHPEADMRRWIGSADPAGPQVAVHAIGDHANAILLSIYDSVARAHGARDRRFRVEHAQHLRPQDIPLFGKLGVIASVQPYHAIDDGRWVERRIGPVRIKTTYPFRTLLDTGGRPAFGSDWTVAPLDPILGVYAAVTRRTLDGRNPDGWVPEQKISVGEALRAYTAGNAYATFDEPRRGTLP